MSTSDAQHIAGEYCHAQRPQAYEDAQGRVIFVSQGIGKGDDPWGAFRTKKASGSRPVVVSIQRVVSPTLPMVSCRAEAQRNLDLYARHHGWHPVPTCSKCSKVSNASTN